MKVTQDPELVIEAPTCIERIEVDPYESVLVLQYEQVGRDFLWVWPTGVHLAVSQTSILDHVQGGWAYLLWVGPAHESGVVGAGAVDLATGRAFWQAFAGGRWLPGVQASVWLQADGRGFRFEPPNLWVELSHSQLDAFKSTVIERERDLATVLGVADWVEPEDSLHRTILSEAAIEVSRLAKPALLYVRHNQSWAVAYALVDSTSSSVNIAMGQRCVETGAQILHHTKVNKLPDGMMIWCNELWYLVECKRLFRLAGRGVK